MTTHADASVPAFLAGVPCLAGLLPSELRALAAASVVRGLRRGEVFLGAGKEPGFWWLVRSGLILRTAFTDDGRSLTVDLRRPGETCCCPGFGESAALELETSALVDSVVVGVPLKPALEAVSTRPGLAKRLVAELAARLRESQAMRLIAVEPAPRRVYRVLVWLHGKLGPRLPFTRKAVAEMAGLPRETATRALSPLEKKGWIRTKLGHIRILRPEKIERMLA